MYQRGTLPPQPKRRHRTRHFDDHATPQGPGLRPCQPHPSAGVHRPPQLLPPPWTVQALIGEGPSAERPPPPHCPGRPHDCAERRTMGPVQRPEEVCLPPHSTTAVSSIPSPLTDHTQPRHCARQSAEKCLGAKGLQIAFLPYTPPPPMQRSPSVMCHRRYVQPRHLHATPSALHGLVPSRCLGTGLLTTPAPQPMPQTPPPNPQTQASLRKAQHNTKAAKCEFRFQSTLPDSLHAISREITSRLS